jgi:hypothetical protein
VYTENSAALGGRTEGPVAMRPRDVRRRNGGTIKLEGALRLLSQARSSFLTVIDFYKVKSCGNLEERKKWTEERGKWWAANLSSSGYERQIRRNGISDMFIIE